MISDENIISILELEDKEFSTLTHKILIFSDENEFYYLKDTAENFKEISKMPDYIKKDWVDNNKKEVNLIILNNQIKVKKDMLEVMKYGTKEAYQLEQELNKLITLRTYIISNGKL